MSFTVDGESQRMPPGRYECDLHKADGARLFHDRLVILDAPFPLPGI